MSGVRLGRGFPNNQVMRLLPPPPRVLPDAVGAGVEATTGGSFLHPVGGAASLVLVGVSSFASGPGTMTVTLGGAAMTQVASSQYYSNGVNSSGQVAVYSMFNPPKNNQTVAVSFTGSYSYAVTANSVSYAGVVSLGTPAQASGSTSPAAQSASGGDPRGGFFQMLGGYANFTGYNQNERWVANISGNARSCLIGDALWQAVPHNPLAAPDARPWFTIQVLCAGVAEWAWQAAKAFVDEWQTQLGLTQTTYLDLDVPLPEKSS